MEKDLSLTTIPTRLLGPFHFSKLQSFESIEENISEKVPLATYETTLFYSVSRGARAIQQSGGLTSTLLSDSMVRSVTLRVEDPHRASIIVQSLKRDLNRLQDTIVAPLSRYAQLVDIQGYHVGPLLYLRIKIDANNASGHNMVTVIADRLVEVLVQENKDVQYISVSGNMCVDKKVSVINAIEGRGKHIISEITIPRDIVEKTLKSTPEKIVELNIHKNLIGSIMAGSVLSANAHYANMLLATYLATGQDAANIVEGSQGITFAEIRQGDLYFSVNIPNIIVGTVGHGKQDPIIQQRFEAMHCVGEGSSRRYAHLVAATVLAGELSLMAALTNPHELVKAHVAIERK
jgi:hydroxymethylglutaryl-CoA reductase (NADPH)